MKDLKISYKGNTFGFKFLDWDTKFFGVNSYIMGRDDVRFKRYSGSLLKYILNKLPKKSFITTRISTNANQKLIELFFGLGFKYIDTALTYSINKEDSVFSFNRHFNPTVKVIKLNKNRNLPYKALGSVFNLTRFHKDTKIGIKKANQLWIEYIKNFVPNTLNHIFVARIGKKIIGALLLKEREEHNKRIAEIFFFGVIKNHRNKGVGSALMHRAKEWALHRNDTLLIGTQSKNNKTANFYVKNGFLLRETNLVLHRWG